MGDRRSSNRSRKEQAFYYVKMDIKAVNSGTHLTGWRNDYMSATDTA